MTTRSTSATPQVRVRIARTEDLDSLLRLEKACFRGVYHEHRWKASSFRYYLHSRKALVAVAEAPQGIIGYVAGYFPSGRKARIASLLSLCVLPGHRRDGVGSKLLGRFLREARSRDCREVRLEVAVERSGPRKFFERAGFQALRPLRDYYGGGRDALLMGSQLSR